MPCLFYKCCIERDNLFHFSQNNSRFTRIAYVPKDTVIMGEPIYVKSSVLYSAINYRTDAVTWPYTCLRVVMMCIRTKTRKTGYIVCRPNEWKRYWPKNNLRFRQNYYKSAYNGSFCCISVYFIRVQNLLRVGCIDGVLQVGFIDDARVLQKLNSKQFDYFACSSKPVTFPLFKIRKSNDNYIATHLLDKRNPYLFQQNEVEGAKALHQLQHEPVHCRLV
jgi:hypothetical protein